ncbi:hypothetical protein SPV1_02677 [Mariprofundus ferrooxydans PV-1]|uniref:Uncharacterized protein n=2 Tax=Mariprofundus ferrooxydans TaxID=314344 RepID=Q0F1T3_9PROT|nr:hypothetical protein SPV1_02677 [Mariprofundus ferrooxydans PV-1]
MRLMAALPTSSITIANAAAVQLSGNPADAHACGEVQIGAIGSQQVTHTWFNTYLRDIHLPTLRTLAASIPGLTYTTDNPGQDTTDPACISSPKGSPLTWEQFLAAQGLQVIQPVIP